MRFSEIFMGVWRAALVTLVLSLVLQQLYSSSSQMSAAPAAPELSTPMGDLRAIIVGGTGAIGRSLVRQLLADERYASVTTIGRRKVPLDDVDAAVQERKLKQVLVDMDELGASDAWQNQDVAFCALGTTRGAAGSAEGFVKVDRDYVEAAGVAAKAGGVKHFSLVTAQGAKDVWVPHTALHPLLYAKTKFEAQQVRHPRSLSPTCTLRTFC